MKVWTLYYDPPETRNWRITGKDVDGKQRIEVEVEIDCRKYRHAPNLGFCKFCELNHELPERSDERYVYRWYPAKPSLKAVMQWERRRREKELL